MVVGRLVGDVEPGGRSRQPAAASFHTPISTWATLWRMSIATWAKLWRMSTTTWSPRHALQERVVRPA